LAGIILFELRAADKTDRYYTAVTLVLAFGHPLHRDSASQGGRQSDVIKFLSGFGFQFARQFVFGALDLAEERSVVRMLPLFASRHALAARGEHLTRVLFPNVESVHFSSSERSRSSINSSGVA
jgi:hypothetical protein